MAAVRFLLNGEARAEDGVSPTVTVLDWLRTRARLTGTKEGCAEGDCGTCTIALKRPGADRFEAVNSCLMLLPQLDCCEVLTVEGLSAPDGALHPVQQALVEAHATQCGFCSPGFVMAMFAFHEGGEPAEDSRIHEALAGNLCRCTGYRSIVDACRKVVMEDEPRMVAARVLPRGSDRGAIPRSRLAALASKDGIKDSASTYAHAAQVFHAPPTLDELLELRACHPGAILLAGGTDLGLRVSKQQEAFPRVISITGVAELRQVRVQADALEIGGAATYTDVLPSIDQTFPAFGALIRRIGSRQIRNLGTLAGNLATASPIGDTLPCLIALDAEILLRSRAGARTMKVENFITGYRKTALSADEIIYAIRIPFLPSGQDFAAYKVSKRFDQDISTVVAAFRLGRTGGRVSDIRAVFGGMAARSTRATTLERALLGCPWTQADLTQPESALAQDFSPLSDHRGSDVYRLRVAAGLVQRFLLETTSAAAPTRVEAL